MKRALGVAFGLIFACHVADAAETSGDWRKVDPANLLLIETKYGTTAVELAPAFAPSMSSACTRWRPRISTTARPSTA